MWKKRPSPKPSTGSEGVSFNYLKKLKVKGDFQQACKLIKKLTKNCSLVDYLKRTRPGSVKDVAEVFISYAWNGDWGATMNAIQSKYPKGDVFIWMDIACINQHVTEDLDFIRWKQVFEGNLQVIGKALVVMIPAEKPIATSRSWCTFEWAVIKQVGIPFDYCVDPADKERLITKMQKGMAGFEKIFSGIDVENAKAFKPSDQHAILDVLKEIGIVKVNDVVMHSLKNFLLDICIEAERRATPAQLFFVWNTRGNLHGVLGEYDEAASVLRKALTQARKDNNHSLIGGSAGNLAMVLRKQCNYEEAESLFREALLISELKHGTSSPKLSDDIIVLADVVFLRGNMDEAEELFRRAMLLNDKVTGSSLGGISSILYKRGQFKEAEAMMRESLAIQEVKRGHNHPTIAASLHGIACALQSQGNMEDGLRAGKEALKISTKILGPDHPDTITYRTHWGGS